MGERGSRAVWKPLTTVRMEFKAEVQRKERGKEAKRLRPLRRD
jgi:hypothetical protein